MKVSAEILDEIFEVIKDHRDNPKEGSYVSNLLASGKVCEKIEEEALELIEAAHGEDRQAVVHEAADLLFHTMVLPAAKGIRLEEVTGELKRRRR